jgi:ligand-binding sensor domain-containing protein
VARNKAFPVRGFLALAAVAAFADQLPIHSYTSADGLAGNTIDRILRDSRGYLWFCTREGLSRFDGYQFRNFGLDQGLPPSDSDLIESPAGDFWVATGDGVVHFRPAEANPHFTIYRPDGAAERRFQALARDPDGGIWAGAPTGLYRLDPPQLPATRDWRLHRVEIGLPRQNFEGATVEAVLVDRRGTLWVGARSGLYRRFHDGRREGTRSGPAIAEITSLLEDRDGAIWVGSRHGVCRVDPDRALSGASLAEICAARAHFGGGSGPIPVSIGGRRILGRL